ncbi:hypothetical protein KSS87_020539, partial [Heliosperma pusillum]
CIKWVQEAFPAGGDSSGLVLIYEQCVRTFWHEDQYKEDLRYLKVWLAYAESCADAELIYRFLDANKIGLSHSAYYISYALHLETKHKTKTANEIFNQGLSICDTSTRQLGGVFRVDTIRYGIRHGIRPRYAGMGHDSGTTPRTEKTYLCCSRDLLKYIDLDHHPDLVTLENAQPLQKLEAAYRKFIARSMARPKSTSDEDGTENGQSVRSFGTVLSKEENRRNRIEASDVVKKNAKGNRGFGTVLSVYKDTNTENNSGNQGDSSKLGSRSWDSLPTHRDRNKENTAIPSKWTSFKVPQKPGSRIAVPTASAIEVFVDEPSSELQHTSNEAENTTNLQLKERDEHELKRYMPFYVNLI